MILGYEATRLLVEQLTVVRMCKASAAALIVYDHVITFPQEIELIWRKKRSTPSVLYMLMRYLGDVQLVLTAAVSVQSNLTLKLCTVFIRFESWSGTVVFCSMQAILIIRLLAMYDNPRKLKIGFFIAFATEIALFLVLLILGAFSSQIISHPAPDVPWCSIINAPRWSPVWWAPVILLDFVLFAFAFWIGIRHVREARSLTSGEATSWWPSGVRVKWRWWKRSGTGRMFTKGKERAPNLEIIVGFKPMAMMQIMLRDSVLYYLILLSINTVNSLVWLGMNIISYEVPEVFSLSTVCIMGSRMILNLRHAHYHPEVDQTPLEGRFLEESRMNMEMSLGTDNQQPEVGIAGCKQETILE